MNKETIIKFFKSIKDNHKPLYEPVGHSISNLPLKDMLTELIGIPKLPWGMYSFSRDILKNKISEEEKNNLILKAVECGYYYADKIADQYGTRIPSELAKKMNLVISYPDVPTDLSRVLFGEFVEPDNVIIYKDNLEKANELLEDDEINILLNNIKVDELIIAHEIFHYLEMEYAKDIFTRTEKIELWSMGFIKHTSTIRCLGEIAGMAFAEKLMGLTFSPFVMDVFFVYGYDRGAAEGLYLEIKEITNNHSSIN